MMSAMKRYESELPRIYSAELSVFQGVSVMEASTSSVKTVEVPAGNWLCGQIARGGRFSPH